MTQLLTELHSTVTASREEAAATYRAILARAQSPRPGDTQALRDAMAILDDLTPGDVGQHLQALAKVSALEPLILSPDERQAITDAHAKLLAEAENAQRKELSALAKRIPANLLPTAFVPILNKTDLSMDERQAVTQRMEEIASPVFESQMKLEARLRESDQAAATVAELRGSNAIAFADQ